MSPAAVAKPKHVILYDMTRQRSHLFFRYLSTHPDVEAMWHPILAPFSYGPERLQIETLDINEGDVPPEGSTYQDAIDSIYKVKEHANGQGKMLVMNEHSPLMLKHDLLYAIRDGKEIPDLPNPTVLPDDMIRDAFPIFVIRNPIFSVPSNYAILKATSVIRPGDFSWNLTTGSNLQRMLFDKIKAQHGHPPLVVDGDDVVWRPEEVSSAVCRALGLDGGLSDTWDPVPKEKRHWSSSVRMFLQTIDDSSGIQRATRDRPDTDIDKAYVKWKDDYGEAANDIKETVERNMEHYEYLKQFKV